MERVDPVQKAVTSINHVMSASCPIHLINGIDNVRTITTIHKTLTPASRISAYKSRVSFDTFDNRDATDLSYVLTEKHKDYVSSKRSRLFLCGIDQNDYSDVALEWLLDEMVDDGDEVVCFRVIERDNKINSDSALEKQKYKEEAQKLMEHIKSKNKEHMKSINLVLEFALGKVQETIQSMVDTQKLIFLQIARYSPACLIVGTRGKSLGGIQGLLPGSISKYCLQNSPVPVIVVRPSAKREKKKQKRRADPSRQSYVSILEQGGTEGCQILDNVDSPSLSGQEDSQAREEEARAVARAIGVPALVSSRVDSRRASNGSNSEGAVLSKGANLKSEHASGLSTPSPTGALSPEYPNPGNRRSLVKEELYSSPGKSATEEQ
ncbi:hypothetical protein MMC13_001222 [Lambiella insularis]|nr:hypothetical protein [Lambiella insularis]